MSFPYRLADDLPSSLYRVVADRLTFAGREYRKDEIFEAPEDNLADHNSSSIEQVEDPTAPTTEAGTLSEFVAVSENVVHWLLHPTLASMTWNQRALPRRLRFFAVPIPTAAKRVIPVIEKLLTTASRLPTMEPLPQSLAEVKDLESLIDAQRCVKILRKWAAEA